MAELFSVDVRTISEHLQNILNSDELDGDSVIRKFRTTASDGKSYDTKFYNLDAIISVGYRVNSKRATQFRKWATLRLREYLIKGFTMDDRRLKEGRTSSDYFDELMDRIRDIRSSEKVFYQKIKDIYSACSLDYDPHADMTQQFYQRVQNKLHWAVHKHTAAELIASRANAQKPHMGLTSFPGSKPREADTTIAKNYLKQNELETLNLIVNQYLDFAELQAKRRKSMTMQDWIHKLDDFLKANDLEILESLGRVSKKMAEDHAHLEFEKYKHEERQRDDRKAMSEFEEETKKILKGISQTEVVHKHGEQEND
jgi:hypothetical protein